MLNTIKPPQLIANQVVLDTEEPKVAFRPKRDYILVEPFEDPEGLILIPDIAKKKPVKGIVKATGDIEEDLLIDDIIYFQGHSGSEIIINGIRHLILHIDDVFCKETK